MSKTKPGFPPEPPRTLTSPNAPGNHRAAWRFGTQQGPSMSETTKRRLKARAEGWCDENTSHYCPNCSTSFRAYVEPPADLAALQAENERLKAGTSHVVTCNADHDGPIGGDGCSCPTGRVIKKLRARVTLLQDAIREWTEAVDELERRDGPRVMRGNVRERKAEATLRALVVDPPTLQGDE